MFVNFILYGFFSFFALRPKFINKTLKCYNFLIPTSLYLPLHYFNLPLFYEAIFIASSLYSREACIKYLLGTVIFFDILSIIKYILTYLVKCKLYERLRK